MLKIPQILAQGEELPQNEVTSQQLSMF
jgi:hypothetical protein